MSEGYYVAVAMRMKEMWATTGLWSEVGCGSDGRDVAASPHGTGSSLLDVERGHHQFAVVVNSARAFYVERMVGGD